MKFAAALLPVGQGVDLAFLANGHLTAVAYTDPWSPTTLLPEAGA